MASKLSTHVLDNYHGKPAAGIPWKLEILSQDKYWETIAQGSTNQDGRTDGPLLQADELKTGRYRLSFTVDAYFKQQGVALADPPFLDTISLTVNLQAGQSYHVPLLVTPWSYSTYRGS